jgi:glycolate oxidase FAD binding subunit
MNSVFHRPGSEEEAAAIVGDAMRCGSALRIEGGGTKALVGRPVIADHVLSSTGLSGITLYEPSELVVQARSGTPVSDVEALLRSNGQELPFEPPNFADLFRQRGVPTMGALAAMNLSGPRRISAGAARDCLLGVRFVNGRGETVKAGGRVMKNVTGLDLVKLMAGSWGTLGFLTEVTFKVLPSARSSASVVVEGLGDDAGIEALTSAMGSPYDVSAAAHLPERVGLGSARTLVRIEGSKSSVEIRAHRLQKLLDRYGTITILEREASERAWTDIRELGPLQLDQAEVVLRLCVPPDRGVDVARAASIQVDGKARWFFDWSGGLVWMALPDHFENSISQIQSIAAAAGGHAVVMRADGNTRTENCVFQRLSKPAMALTKQLKGAFDPAGILNPSRVFEGI